MLLSEDFHTAYAGLLELVENISNNKVPQHVLDDKVGEWEQGDCRGSGTLAEAAVKALRYELAKTGLAKGLGPKSRRRAEHESKHRPPLRLAATGVRRIGEKDLRVKDTSMLHNHTN